MCKRQFQERYERPPCEESVPGLRLHYSDWREDDRASRDSYDLVLFPPLAKELRIQLIDRHA